VLFDAVRLEIMTVVQDHVISVRVYVPFLLDAALVVVGVVSVMEELLVLPIFGAGQDHAVGLVLPLILLQVLRIH